MKPLKHHETKAEWINDEHGTAVMLTQVEGWDTEMTVILAPSQLRAVCEHFGILEKDERAAKTIATLQRRMLGLSERIGELQDYMARFSDHKHADLSYEMLSLNALADLATEWCADFEDAEQGNGRRDAAVTTSSAPPPATAAQPEQATLILRAAQ